MEDKANKKEKTKKKNKAPSKNKKNKAQAEKEPIFLETKGVDANTPVYTPQKKQNITSIFETSDGLTSGSSFQPTSSGATTETSAFDLTDYNVAFSPDLEQLNPAVVDLIRPLDAASRLSTEASFQLSRLRNSIRFQNEKRGNSLTWIEHPLYLDEEVMENVKRKLLRTFDEESIDNLEGIQHALSVEGADENDYSEDFAYWFFVHLHKITKYGKITEDSEWTKLINCIALTTNFYVDFFCPKLFQICFDSDYGVFCAPNFVVQRRPDFAMVVTVGTIINKPKRLIACIGEAAKEGFEGKIHKDREKLIKCMRVCIDDQLNHVPLKKCRVIGILHGETQVKIYEMKPVLTTKSKILIYDVYPLHDGLLDLGTVQGLSMFYGALQRVETLVKQLKDNFQDKQSNNKFAKPPQDPYIDRSFSEHRTEPQDKRSGGKKDNNNNRTDNNNTNDDKAEDSEPPQDLEEKLQLMLNGALTDITSGAISEVRVGKLMVDGRVREVALLQKMNNSLELEFLRKFDHPNIVKMFSCYSEPYDGYTAYIIALEKLEFMKRTPRTLRALQIARDVCAGLVYLHSLNIMHRDINPRNIMQDDTGRVKIIDFNLAVELKPGTRCFEAEVGTGGFIAPEVDRMTSYGYDCKADVYSLGQTIRLLYMRQEKDYPPSIRKLIDKCSLHMFHRPSAKQLLEYINSAIDGCNNRKSERQKNNTVAAHTLLQADKENSNPNLIVA